MKCKNCIMRKCICKYGIALRWLHNDCDGVSNHRHLDCMLKRLFRRRSEKTSKFRVTGLCERNPTLTGGFSSQRASNAENISIWWDHHGNCWALRSGLNTSWAALQNDASNDRTKLNVRQQANLSWLEQREYWSYHHYDDVIMIASQITSLTIVYSTVYSGADQRKHQSSASLAFV